MSQIVRIPTDTYKRLEDLAVGFDTPVNVIERLLDFYESDGEVTEVTADKKILIESNKLEEIVFFPEDELVFKKELLQNKVAWVLMKKTDGSVEIKEWNASKLTEDSNVMSNLRSGYLRGWKHKGITKVKISIDRKNLE